MTRSGRYGGAARGGRIPRGPRFAASLLFGCGVMLLVGAVPARAHAAGDLPSTAATAAAGARSPAAGPAAHASPAAGPATASDDVYTVFCLAPDNRAQTAAAAVRLGVARAVPGHQDMIAVGTGRAAAPLTLPRWAAAHPAAFRRVCAAVVGAAAVAPAEADATGGDGSDGLGRTALLTAIGAGITLLAQFVERGTARRRERADSLGQACSAYAEQVLTFLSGWVDNPHGDFAEVRSARTSLAVTLRTLPGHGARRTAAVRLAEGLPLADEPDATVEAGLMGLRALSRQEREELTARLRASLSDALGEAQELAGSSPRWHLRHAGRAAVAGLRRALRGGGATP